MKGFIVKNNVLGTFILVLVVILQSSMPVNDTLNDREKARLIARVKSVMEIKYSVPADDTIPSSDKIIYQKFTRYNPEGFEVESIQYENGQKGLISQYRTDHEGKPVEMNEYKADGKLNLQVVYHYDDKGNITEAEYLWGEDRQISELSENTDYYFELIQNEIFTKVNYVNEYRGYCTQQDFVKADNGLSFKFIYKYDIHGNKLESAYYHGNGRLSWLTKYKYDRYNNLIESRLFKSNRIAVLSTYKHRFDDKGNWIYRKENRVVYVNILTEGLDRNNMITERIIEYYE